ncbi:hypothetical protein P2318_25515 [Myxococcaceae bacterium GXIMD 01537]
MARTLDVTVVVAPALRAAFEGRREISLGVPAPSGVGDVLETLLRLYPRARGLLAGEGGQGGRYLHVALDEHSTRELARGGGGLSAGQRLYLFALSRPSPGGRAGREG